MQAFSREQMRHLDRLAITELGIPGVVLMENAGRSVAEVVLQLLESGTAKKARIAVLCGGGNNGGDGYVIARHLHNRGQTVTLFAAADPRRLTGDAAIHANICAKLKLECRKIFTAEKLAAAETRLAEADLLVDALLGTGFSGEAREPLASVIRCCNELAAQGKKIVAVDVPSGLDCQTGLPSSATIRADVTVTFVALKAGFLRPEAQPFLGRIIIGDIGTPPELRERVTHYGD
jgi:NAD(P)H-hydrate epimerase